MSVTEQLPIHIEEYDRLVTFVIFGWLTATFTLAFLLTLFLP